MVEQDLMTLHNYLESPQLQIRLPFVGNSFLGSSAMQHYSFKKDYLAATAFAAAILACRPP